MVLGEPKALPEVQREAAKKVRTRILHEGRPDVERTIPVLPKRSKTLAGGEDDRPTADDTDKSE